jgi:hypothetical protein
MDTKLTDKLGKILALTKSPVEGEAQAATEMLHKLLTKHNLDIADLETAGQASAPGIVEETVKSDLRADGKTETRGAWHGQWKLELGSVLAEHFFCHAIRSDWRRSVAFIGRPDNVDSLKMLYGWLVGQIARLTPIERHAYMERTGEDIHAVRWYKAFTAGAVERLEVRLAELKAQQAADVSTVALVIHHDAEISDYLESTDRSRIDGKLTKHQQEAQDKARRAEAEWRELLKTDPEAAYRKRPWERPATPEQLRKQAKADAAYARRARRGRSYASRMADYDRNVQGDAARRAGAASANGINLSPFIAGGKATKQESLK